MKITAIIITYNRPDALQLVLQSIIKQKLVPHEVIIADDGSGPETLNLISKFKKDFPTELKHVWHEDNGFRISTIRNKAIKESTGDCLIFSDGDLLFHPAFFYDFSKSIQKGTALIGSRVFLKESYSLQLLNSSKFKSSITAFSSCIEKNRLNAIRIPLISRLIPFSSFSVRLRGGLLAVSKKDIIAVNGWNEDFIGWGKEDTELVARLFHYGIRFKKLKFSGLTYHLWHPVLNRSKVNINEKLLQASIKKKLVWCNNGLSPKEDTI